MVRFFVFDHATIKVYMVIDEEKLKNLLIDTKIISVDDITSFEKQKKQKVNKRFSFFLKHSK